MRRVLTIKPTAWLTPLLVAMAARSSAQQNAGIAIRAKPQQATTFFISTTRAKTTRKTGSLVDCQLTRLVVCTSLRSAASGARFCSKFLRLPSRKSRYAIDFSPFRSKEKCSFDRRRNSSDCGKKRESGSKKRRGGVWRRRKLDR